MNTSLLDTQGIKSQGIKPQGISVFPVPDDAPKLSQSHSYQYFADLFKGEADHHYAYRDLQGRILGYILRWNAVRQKNGDIKKEIRPFIYAEFPGKKRKWCSQGFPAPRPLFNLDKITKRPETPVLISEGEKTALSAETLFPSFIVTTTMQGAQSAKKTDYTPLKGRDVIIAMDQDDAGLMYGKDIYGRCQLAGAKSIQFLNNEVFSNYAIQAGAVVKREQPVILVKGYDLANALMEGWTYELLSEFKDNPAMPLFVTHETMFAEIKNNSDDNDDADTTSLKRLAALSDLHYDRLRKFEAKRLGISLSTLDKAVEKFRPQNTNTLSEESSNIFPVIEPWAYQVTAEELLQELSHAFKRFAILPEHADAVLALWVIFTWLIDNVGVSPILAISSPEKRCGKTTVMSILGNLVCKPILASNISAAALFRTIELWKPTIIIDEADTFIRDSDELRGIINSGHTRPTAYVIRTTGDDHTPKRFSTWGAKAIAIIGSLPDTLHDRSIVIQLRRKLINEKTEKLRHANLSFFNDLQRKLLRFSHDHGRTIEKSFIQFPENIRISDRALDNWEPLLAIAKLAGTTWTEKVYKAAVSLSENDKEALPIGTELLKDIEKIFQQGTQGKFLIKIHTVDLIHYLCEDEESPWSVYNFRGLDKKITPRQLSKLLSPYQIRTKNMEIGGVQRKGFDRHQFEEAWERYNNSFSSAPPENAVRAVQPSTEPTTEPPTDKENSPSAVALNPSTYPFVLPSDSSSSSPPCPSALVSSLSIRPENLRKTAGVDG